MRKIIFLVSFLFILTGVVQPALSDPVTLMPVLTINQMYNDNINFSKSNEEHDLVTTASGNLYVKQKTQRLDASVGGGFDKIIYQRFNEYDSLQSAIN